MVNFNKVILMGRLTHDVELKSVNHGTSLAELGIAVNERRPDRDGGWKDEVHFINVAFWGKKAEVISQYLSKGDPILIEGRLKQQRWEVNGKKHSRVNVFGEQFSFVGIGRSQATINLQPTEVERSVKKEQSITPPDDDIPF